MIEKLLHTPEGVRDIYDTDCKKKDCIQKRLSRIMELFGYQNIETPAFEYFDVFNTDTGTVASTEMYKFFDRENNTLVLRPDMTPSIARSAAKYYSDCALPLRLSYLGNTYLNSARFQGKLKEKTEIGAEHYNEDTPEADAEGIVMMIECFIAAGLKDFRIDIGQVDFYKAIMDDLEVSPDIKEKIHGYVMNKNALGMENLLEELTIPEETSRVLLAYNDLFGGIAMLDEAERLTSDSRCHQALDRLRDVYRVLELYGYESYVSFDLGMVNHFDSYTGIIFRGYTFGTGDAIGKGGRYDNLLAKFGMDAPAIGFTILVDDLMMALSRQNIPVSLKSYAFTVLVYEQTDPAEAISLAMELRNAGIKVQLIARSTKIQEEEYREYVRNQGAQMLIWLADRKVTIHDYQNGTVRIKELEEFRREF